MKSRFAIKCAAAGIAYVPAAILGLGANDAIHDRRVLMFASIFNLPPAAIASLPMFLGVSAQVTYVFWCAVVLAWASGFAVMFWSLASKLLGEKCVQEKAYQAAFRGRFLAGAFFGGLLGWLLWIPNYGWPNGLACEGAGAIVVGLTWQMAWRDRPLKPHTLNAPL